MPNLGSSEQKRKLAQREQLFPLIKELARRMNVLGLHTADLVEKTGLPDYQVNRILSATTGTPNWVEMTMVAVACGMSPNEAAKVAGLYHGEYDQEDGVLEAGPFDRQLLTLIHDENLSEEDREDIVRAFLTFLQLEKDARIRRFRPVISRPIQTPQEALLARKQG